MKEELQFSDVFKFQCSVGHDIIALSLSLALIKHTNIPQSLLTNECSAEIVTPSFKYQTVLIYILWSSIINPFWKESSSSNATDRPTAL